MPGLQGCRGTGEKQVTVIAARADGTAQTFRATVRIDTPKEVAYYQHGGILEYVLRQLAGLARTSE